MSEREASQQGYASAQMREAQEGRLGDRDTYADEFAGVVDDDTLELLTKYREAFARSPSENFEDTATYDELMRAASNRRASTAIDKGNVSVLQNFVGLRESGNDASGVQLLRRLQSVVSEEAWTCYLYGKTDAGKTDLSLLFVELWRDERTDGVVGTNVRSVARAYDWAVFIDEYDDLLEWLETDGYKFFLFDEASSHASGYSGQASDGRRLGRLVNLFRKYKASLLIIGHTGKDVHADIRRKSSHLIIKDDKKTARVYEPVQDVEGEVDVQKRLHLKGIPKTTLQEYDTREASSWSWSEPDQNRRVRLMSEKELTQKEIAEIEGISQTKVSRIIRSGPPTASA